jgi:hypothetical protein
MLCPWYTKSYWCNPYYMSRTADIAFKNFCRIVKIKIEIQIPERNENDY